MIHFKFWTTFYKDDNKGLSLFESCSITKLYCFKFKVYNTYNKKSRGCVPVYKYNTNNVL